MGSRLTRIDENLFKEIMKVKKTYEIKGIDLSFPEASKLVFLDLWDLKQNKKKKSEDDIFDFSL